MEVHVLDVPSLDEIKSIEKLQDPQVFYNMFDGFNVSDDEKFRAFISIIDYEFKTFIGMMDFLFDRSEWYFPVNYMKIPNELTTLGNNHILNLLGSSLNLKDLRFLFDNSEHLMDVYTIDNYIFNSNKCYSHVLVISYKGRYYGHVYINNNHDCDEEPISIVGIRSSLYNLLCENHGFQKIKNIAYYILHAYLSLAKSLGIDVITIESPIGVMVKLANKFGFDDDFYFSTTKIPNVNVGRYKLIL